MDYLPEEKKSSSNFYFIRHKMKIRVILLIFLQRHPEICVFDGTDQLVDNLLKFPEHLRNSQHYFF
jgi:hypothetical protein